MSLVCFKDLCLDVNDLHTATSFWAGTLGRDIHRIDGDPDDLKLVGPTRHHTVWPCVVPEQHAVKNRVHLDVLATSFEPFGGLRRLTAAGELPWTTLAAPEGDEFCVFLTDDPGVCGLKDVVVDCPDHAAISRWWADVWGGTLVHDEEHNYSYLDDIPNAPVESFDFVPVPEPKTVKNRVHWDVTLEPGASIGDLEEAGARVLRRPDQEIEWTVMADPDGNEFCVFGRE